MSAGLRGEIELADGLGDENTCIVLVETETLVELKEILLLHIETTI